MTYCNYVHHCHHYNPLDHYIFCSLINIRQYLDMPNYKLNFLHTCICTCTSNNDMLSCNIQYTIIIVLDIYPRIIILSCPRQVPLPYMCPCTAFYGVNLAAFISYQMYGIIYTHSQISAHAGQNRELCLSAHRINYI